MRELDGKKILVVDDEKDLLEAIRFELELEGSSVYVAPGGDEAFELIKKTDFDLVISDVKMPNGDGVYLTDLIKKRNPIFPHIILISGFSDLTPDQAYHKGVVGLISKPFDPHIFINTVKRAVLPYSKMWAEPLMNDDKLVEIKISGLNVQEMVQKNKLVVGRGGLFIPMNHSFPHVGTNVIVRLNFEEKPKNILCTGVVRWCRETTKQNLISGIGIEFLGMTKESIEIFEKIVHEMPKLIAFIPAG